MSDRHVLIGLAFVAAAWFITVIKRKLDPRGIRNHNPGNIKAKPGTWEGQQGSDAHGFAVFSSPLYGIRAMQRILDTYAGSYGIVTLEEIITRYAPPSENDTAAYIAHMVEATGIPPNGHVIAEDERLSLIRGMIAHENGQQPFTDDYILDGMRLAA